MKLIVIAGCNGAGKSTYGRTLINSFVDNQDFIYIDLDNVAKQLEKKFPIIEELNEKVQEYFVSSIKEAILKKKIFIYESNLRVNPFNDINRFIQAGYEKVLLFFTLQDVTTSLSRVHHRVEVEKGNYVSDEDVNENFKLGLINLNDCYRRGYSYFDLIHIFECDSGSPLLSVSISDKEIQYLRSIPTVLESKWTTKLFKAITEKRD